MRDYCYINPVRVDSFFSQLNGSLIKEQKERAQKGLKGTGKMALEFGSILAKLGLGKAGGEAQVSSDYAKISETISALSVANRIDFVLEFHDTRKSLAVIKLEEHVDTYAVQSLLAGVDLAIFQGEFRVSIDNASRDEVREALFKAFHYVCALRYGGRFGPEKLTHREATLQSKVKTKKSGVPLITAPLFLEHIVPNQIFCAMGDIFMSMELIGNAMVHGEGFVVNPLGISLRY
jgi:hypothetical protein